MVLRRWILHEKMFYGLSITRTIRNLKIDDKMNIMKNLELEPTSRGLNEVIIVHSLSWWKPTCFLSWWRLGLHIIYFFWDSGILVHKEQFVENNQQKCLIYDSMSNIFSMNKYFAGHNKPFIRKTTWPSKYWELCDVVVKQQFILCQYV